MTALFLNVISLLDQLERMEHLLKSGVVLTEKLLDKKNQSINQRDFHLGDLSECENYKFHRYAVGSDKNGYSYEDWMSVEKYSEWWQKKLIRTKLSKRTKGCSISKKKLPKDSMQKLGNLYTRSNISRQKIHSLYE